MKVLFVITALLLTTTAGAQQANPQPPSAAQQQPANLEELLKNLSPKERDELLKGLQRAAGSQAPQPTDGTTAAPPPQASSEPKIPAPAPPKPKASAGCEASQAVGTAARLAGILGIKPRIWIAQKTGRDVIGEATETAKIPC